LSQFGACPYPLRTRFALHPGYVWFTVLGSFSTPESAVSTFTLARLFRPPVVQLEVGFYFFLSTLSSFCPSSETLIPRSFPPTDPTSLLFWVSSLPDPRYSRSSLFLSVLCFFNCHESTASLALLRGSSLHADQLVADIFLFCLYVG